MLKKPQKRKLERNFNHMSMVFDSINLTAVIYTKQYLVLSFMQNKQSLKQFMRENAKNA